MATVMGCVSAGQQDVNRTFFQEEYGVETHGRKTWFDHLIEVDPGGIKTTIAPDYDEVAPPRIAVLPFVDRGSAQYEVDKIPLTHRNAEEQAKWSWTDSNRLRRAVNGHLASREFLTANLVQIDQVMKNHGIWDEASLMKVPPEKLGEWLGVDAVVYGEVTHYDAYYFALVSAWQVGVRVRMVSVSNGKELFVADGSRYAVDLRPVFDPMGIALNSALSLLELRDVTLARAEEETAREVVLRIPRCDRLQKRLIEETRATPIEGFSYQVSIRSQKEDYRAR